MIEITPKEWDGSHNCYDYENWSSCPDCGRSVFYYNKSLCVCSCWNWLEEKQERIENGHNRKWSTEYTKQRDDGR